VIEAGKHVDWKIRRINLAERLYRLTGAGIYRDTLLAGLRAPLAQPMLNGKVLGQDTAVALPYDNKLFWCWGDTTYPAGFNFAVSCATSEMPGRGGLPPSAGINFNYFLDPEGAARRMLPLDRRGLVWIEGMFTVNDATGRPRLIATYTRQNGLKPPDERGVAVFDDAAGIFRVLTDRLPKERYHKSSHPRRIVVDGKAWWYLYPHERVPDEWNAIQNPAAYETLKFDHNRFRLLDADTGKETGARPSSFAWNDYRRKWILLSENTGSVYYSESSDVTGPWDRAKKIVSHNAYNFYNVVHHPFFDEEGGKVIYFEGTYTASFSAAKEKTPRYDYNQVMYRLRLDQPGLR
jgi:hypothetical protein